MPGAPPSCFIGRRSRTRRDNCKPDQRHRQVHVVEGHDERLAHDLRIDHAVCVLQPHQPAAKEVRTSRKTLLEIRTIGPQTFMQAPVVRLEPLFPKTGDAGKADRTAKVARYRNQAVGFRRVIHGNRRKHRLLERDRR